MELNKNDGNSLPTEIVDHTWWNVLFLMNWNWIWI